MTKNAVSNKGSFRCDIMFSGNYNGWLIHNLVGSIIIAVAPFTNMD